MWQRGKSTFCLSKHHHPSILEANYCDRLLEAKHYRVWDPQRRVFRKSPNTTPGVSDLCCLAKSQLYAIEVKTARGKQSPEQIIFQQNVEKNGGIYLIARCIDDIVNAGL